MASGRPVIALGHGGSLDSMKDGITGLLFEHQNSDGLTKAIHRFETLEFDPKAIRKHAEQFDTEKFKAKILTAVNEKWNHFKSTNS